MSLPTSLDPLKACKAGLRIDGNLPASAFTRVGGFDTVHYRFHCFMTEKKEPIIELSLKAQLKLICQRCNQEMQYPLNETITLDEEASFEPMSLLEDELILALPMIPMHEEKDCSFLQNKAYCAAQMEENTYKPFADLSNVMNSKE